MVLLEKCSETVGATVLNPNSVRTLTWEKLG